MKNRIIWIFEPGAQNSAPQTGEAAFVNFPWAIFGNLGKTEREEMQRIYEAAWAKTQAQQALALSLENLESEQSEEPEADLERFKRLLGDWETEELYGDA